ncbi:hypothetical protein [Streptomyces lavendofoliae]|uniref:hypothetical protein n=1 Tax=Streptomyces lavendofoliae TaxID=67314 RepID=UPI003D8ECF2A
MVVEYDGAYWHRGRIGPDREKALVVRDAGYRMVRVREAPLKELAPDDVVIGPKAGAHADASAVLGRMVERGWLPARAASVAEEYAAAGQLRGAELCAALLDEVDHLSNSKRRRARLGADKLVVLASLGLDWAAG